MYPPELVKPMREDLTNIGFEELHSSDAVDSAISQEGQKTLDALAKYLSRQTGRIVISENGPDEETSLGLKRSLAMMNYLLITSNKICFLIKKKCLSSVYRTSLFCIILSTIIRSGIPILLIPFFIQII